ncbi:TPA: hypothetical protein RJX18_000189 [Legionella pneumophila]|nr:hypothetical protein [Legionella pneumophila]HAU1838693.1 hypothetical protein [Legionella pneumophila]HAW6257991.1 hypothetical protein [Legionella pneumophila]HAW6264282.1 hypothetical protein [Legionella pneumophila]HBD7333455.1 hypothetical protein [Legionella pneumophila]HCC0305882.1 hypothetical protein [Legionella pneumophila]
MKMIKVGQSSRLSQGDVIRHVDYIEYAIEKDGILEISKIKFPNIIVLSQDCDLTHDYHSRWARKKYKNQDKYLLSVLVAPLYNVDHFFNGEHLSELNIKMDDQLNRNKTPGKNIFQNVNPRYHYVNFPENIPAVPSIIDFKHYFSVNVKYLKEHKRNNFVCQIGELYREQISARFSAYLARIGLPD